MQPLPGSVVRVDLAAVRLDGPPAAREPVPGRGFDRLPRLSPSARCPSASLVTIPPHSSSTSTNARPLSLRARRVTRPCARVYLNAFCRRFISADARSCGSTSTASAGSPGSIVSRISRSLRVRVGRGGDLVDERRQRHARGGGEAALGQPGVDEVAEADEAATEGVARAPADVRLSRLQGPERQQRRLELGAEHRGRAARAVRPRGGRSPPPSGARTPRPSPRSRRRASGSGRRAPRGRSTAPFAIGELRDRLAQGGVVVDDLRDGPPRLQQGARVPGRAGMEPDLGEGRRARLVLAASPGDARGAARFRSPGRTETPEGHRRADAFAFVRETSSSKFRTRNSCSMTAPRGT